MSVVATAELEPDSPEGNVQFIVDDENSSHLGLEERAQSRHRATRGVHERMWLGEHRPCAGEPRLHDVGSSPVGSETAPDPLGKQVEDHEPDIVPVTGICRAWIAQPHNQPRPGDRAVGLQPGHDAVPLLPGA